MSQTAIKYIGFRVKDERDEEIVDWWRAMPSGERSHVLRSLIRAYLCGEIIITPEGEEPTQFSHSLQLAQIQTQANWIRNTLLDLPAYLEHLIGGVKAAPTPAPVQTQPKAAAAAAVPAPQASADNQLLTEQTTEARAQRILNREW